VTILACLHQTANTATAMQERNDANRAHSIGPSATAYIDRDGSIVRAILPVAVEGAASTTAGHLPASRGRGRTVPSVLSVAVEGTTRATSAISEASRVHRDHPRMLHGLAGPAADRVDPDGEPALIRRGRNPRPRVGPALDGHPAA
jgi:hypothetical protein